VVNVKVNVERSTNPHRFMAWIAIKHKKAGANRYPVEDPSLSAQVI
jgi:hypothetical protein